MAAEEVSNASLEKLHEVLLPEPVSWMPQTVGWYAVLGLILLVTGYWIYGRLRRFQENRYRRLALAGLAVIEEELDEEHLIMAIAAILWERKKNSMLGGHIL